MNKPIASPYGSSTPSSTSGSSCDDYTDEELVEITRVEHNRAPLNKSRTGCPLRITTDFSISNWVGDFISWEYSRF
jgi:hypothetical protein